MPRLRPIWRLKLSNRSNYNAYVDINQQQDIIIRITSGKTDLFATLSKTKAASDFLNRLPLSLSGSDSLTGYYSFCVPRGCYDPAEMQIGWKNGDLCLADGCFAITYGGEEDSELCKDVIVIGHLDKQSLEKIRKLPKRITLTITPIK